MARHLGRSSASWPYVAVTDMNHCSHAYWTRLQYTYMLTIPLVGIFAIGFAIIKYQTGYSFVPGYGSRFFLCVSRPSSNNVILSQMNSNSDTIRVMARVSQKSSFPSSITLFDRLVVWDVSTLSFWFLQSHFNRDWPYRVTHLEGE